MMGLARQIALPHEYAPQRFPSFPALERTAVMGFCQPTTLALTASVAVKMMLARQAAYPLWAEYDPGAFAYTVSYASDQVSGAASDTNTVEFSGMRSSSVGNVTAGADLPGIAGAVAALPYAPVGIDVTQAPFIWVPPGYTLLCCILRQNATGNTTYGVTLEQWSAPGQFDTVLFSSTVAAGNRSVGNSVGGIPQGGWFRPRSATIQNDAAASQIIGPIFVSLTVCKGFSGLVASATVFPTITVTNPALVGFLPLVAPAEFSNSQLPWFATRTTSAAVLGTNVSQVLNKAGTILGGRVSPNVINPFTVSQSYVNTLHPAEKAWLPLETGIYTYCPPSTDLSNFWDYTTHVQGSGSIIPVYRLDNDSLVNVAFLTAGSVTETLAVTLDWHIEFRTSSALFQIGLSTLPLEVLHQAQLSLTQAGYFFENPEHKSVLQKVVAAVKRFAPHLMSAAGSAFPQYMGALNAARNLLLPQPKAIKMKPTTAQSSGITRKKVVVARPRNKKRAGKKGGKK